MTDHSPDKPWTRSSGWPTRLVAKTCQVDTLACTRCGQRISTIAFLA